ncbi:MAG TPA: response regulator, partial [Gemmataceae bacterium]|nr:response regulator [Gemmataceae bacterium]
TLPPLRILAAEDNAVNRRLLVGLLERLGHTVTLAGTGREALEILTRGAFDLILMDVQMPEMDGFQTTAAVRERERGTGRRVPIVALTAHAMAGDRERCLAAGMDGYVTKPVRAEALVREMAAVLRLPAPPAPPPPADVMDADPLIAECGPELVREMAGICAADNDRLLADIRAAVAAGDGPRLRLAAHALKGAVANFNARAAAALARELEVMGSDGALAGAPAAVAALERELGRLDPALRALATGDAHARGQ